MSQAQQIAKYQNGNTEVTILSDGTKIREYTDIPKILHPESIDIKITDYCDMGCAYCHESSTKQGIHGDLTKLLQTISNLPAGVELAIGGGNPLSHPDLYQFLEELKSRGLIANLTINQGHLKPYSSLIKTLISDDLVKGIGISITSSNFNQISQFLSLTDNIVYHTIAGVTPTSYIENLIKLNEFHDKDCKVLVLGYKLFGFGVNYYSQAVNESLKIWYKALPRFIGKCTLSFDNLAIEQLKVRRLFTGEGWTKFYMGDDFHFTMYIDAVKGEYAPTSRSRESTRVPFSQTTLLEYFNNR